MLGGSSFKGTGDLVANSILGLVVPALILEVPMLLLPSLARGNHETVPLDDAFTSTASLASGSVLSALAPLAAEARSTEKSD